MNESNSEVTQCEQCHRAFPSQYSQELFAARAGAEAFASGLMQGNGLESEEDDEDLFGDEDESMGLEDAADHSRIEFGLTGLTVRW